MPTFRSFSARRRRALAGAVLVAALLPGAAVPAKESKDSKDWLGGEMPLPLAVKTPQDLAVKAVAERQYLIFNLVAGGKVAWDAGDFATAFTPITALPPGRFSTMTVCLSRSPAFCAIMRVWMSLEPPGA